MKKTYKVIIAVLILVVNVFALNSQTPNSKEINPEHKIIFQLTSGDTTAHKQLMKQFNNILSVSPTTKIEVVCHGAGLDMLVTGKTIVEGKIKLLADKGVVFNACEFSIKERKEDRSKIVSAAGFVAAGIIEIVSKQEQGWSYIKAGN
ncbi:MAG: DsrE family protein [Sphingobacteriaceae bacterium]|nr:DsrE family protein [Sphingobacteriaceae bacterium]